MKQISLVVLVMLVSMFTNSAHAFKDKLANQAAEEYVSTALPDVGTVWHCWYDGITSILCRMGESINEVAISHSSQPETPADSRLAGIVKPLWNQAAELAEELIAIPLHAPPIDMAFTGELAESVMCGGTKTPCGVIFASNATVLANLVNKRNVQLATRQSVRLALKD